MLDDTARLGLGTNHVAGSVLQIDDWRSRLAAQLDELRRLGGAVSIDGSVIGNQADPMAFDRSVTAKCDSAVVGLEVQKIGAINQPRDDLACVIGLPVVGRHQAE